MKAEKFTLAEALREAEAEIDSLKSKVATSEEQCGHLVRLGEQRHQEILSLETQLKAMEDKAKEMLLAQVRNRRLVWGRLDRLLLTTKKGKYV